MCTMEETETRRRTLDMDARIKLTWRNGEGLELIEECDSIAIGEARARELAEHFGRTVIVYLDGDAWYVSRP